MKLRNKLIAAGATIGSIGAYLGAALSVHAAVDTEVVASSTAAVTDVVDTAKAAFFGVYPLVFGVIVLLTVIVWAFSWGLRKIFGRRR